MTIVTERSEYRFEDGVCTGQRVRGEHGWRSQHPCVGQRLLGVLAPRERIMIGAPPAIGTRLIVGDAISSTIIAIELNASAAF